jgi:hypothetical protein
VDAASALDRAPPAKRRRTLPWNAMPDVAPTGPA